MKVMESDDNDSDIWTDVLLELVLSVAENSEWERATEVFCVATCYRGNREDMRVIQVIGLKGQLRITGFLDFVHRPEF
jgi:hypothetical protein